MHCHPSRRSHEQPCAQAEFWGVISTLTQDLTRARNQLARLMKLTKPPGGSRRLFAGNCGSRPSPPPTRNYLPCVGSQAPNRYRLPLFGCSKQYPDYNDPPPEPRRPPCRPAAVCGATSFRPRPRSFGSGRSQQRPSWSFQQPQEQVPYSCEKEYRYSSQENSRAPEAPYSCERQESKSCGRSRPSESSCVQICINPHPPAPPPPPRPPCLPTPSPCRRGSGPARLQGGRGRDCIATQFADLLQDVTCQLRERRLAATEERRF